MPDVPVPWPELESLFRAHIASTLSLPLSAEQKQRGSGWVAPEEAHYELTLTFALGRLEEGRQLAAFFRARGVTGRVLDIGAGNGGVSLAMANDPDFEVTACDVVYNADLHALRRRTDAPLEQVIGSGHQIPFAGDSFDIVLCLDTIEHVPRPDLLGPEIMRVLEPGGVCMITTPPRLRYLFARDPHYFIPGLILLPDALQRFVATKVLRRTDKYDVVHIFWSVDEIMRHFPGAAAPEVLWNHDYRGAVNPREWLWFAHRFRLWDRIVITKPRVPPGRRPEGRPHIGPN